MKRTNSRPVILPIPTAATLCDEAATVPFPRRLRIAPRRRRAAAPRPIEPVTDEARDAALTKMRGRLLKMILANEWDRTHGHRAS